MTPVIFLDSSPLGLVFQKPGIKEADECRQWLKSKIDAGGQIIVPEIICYELKRELLRVGNGAAVAALLEFNSAKPGRFLPVSTTALDLAAELWARARRQGKPTADPHALDIDVILAAQALTSGFAISEIVIATSNLAHLSQFAPARLWRDI
jgi:predicted nucleic acid-binding protein